MTIEEEVVPISRPRIQKNILWSMVQGDQTDRSNDHPLIFEPPAIPGPIDLRLVYERILVGGASSCAPPGYSHPNSNESHSPMMEETLKNDRAVIRPMNRRVPSESKDTMHIRYSRLYEYPCVS